MWKRVNHYLKYIYLFMVKIMLFDSWILSRISIIRKCKNPKVFGVALLPLLLLTGCWCLLYFSTLLLPTKVITRQVKEIPELVTSDKRSFLMGELFRKENNFKSITKELHSRINSLEDRIIQQSGYLFKIIQALERLREREYVWSKHNDEALLLEKRLEEFKQEIEAVKTQLERLKEFNLELKLCCNTCINYITSEDLETILAGHFHTLMPKTGIVEVKDISWISDGNVITDDRVRKIVKETLKIYDADKTGRVDYALESAGGQIISTRCTQGYDIKARAFELFPFTRYYENNNNPRTVIQGNPTRPGICWAFQDFPGYLLIKLRSPIYVTGFTVEHAPKSILPNGAMRSAPKKFNVWGFIHEYDSEPVLLGNYEFAASDESLQYFPIQNTAIKTPYQYVELRVHSNHGELEYTCLYRLRIHGKPI